MCPHLDLNKSESSLPGLASSSNIGRQQPTDSNRLSAEVLASRIKEANNQALAVSSYNNPLLSSFEHPATSSAASRLYGSHGQQSNHRLLSDNHLEPSPTKLEQQAHLSDSESPQPSPVSIFYN